MARMLGGEGWYRRERPTLLIKIFGTEFLQVVGSLAVRVVLVRPSGHRLDFGPELCGAEAGG